MSFENMCMNCFETLVQGSVCGSCGFDNDSVSDMRFLSRGYMLSGRYIVGNNISEESDAIIYAGYDTERSSAVIIREFNPKGIANRLEGNPDVHVRERFRKAFTGYKASFIKLWRTLKGMNSLAAVIPVIDVFEENQTAYAVSEKLESITLREFLIKNKDNSIVWDKARLMFMPVLTTLENLHSNGIIHGGICPDNLVLCRDGKVRLAGFCINECSVQGGELEFNENEGYTAVEQYENSHKVCPATDIYAFAACIYRALVGTNPPGSASRAANDKLMIPNRIAEKIPAHVIKALGAGLQIFPEKRIQNVYDYRELLNAAPSVVAKAADIKPVREEPPRPVQSSETDAEYIEEKRQKKNKAVIGVIIAVLIAVIGAGIYIAGFTDLIKPEEKPSETITEKMVAVPDFCRAGYTESDVRNSGSWNAQFAIRFSYEYSSDAEEGIIFRQSVKAGENVKEGSEIVLTVSKGVETAVVPDVGALSREEAVNLLEQAGFKVKVLTVYNDGSHTVGYVKRNGGIAPAEKSEIAKGEEVVIQVYGEVETTTEASTGASTAE